MNSFKMNSFAVCFLILSNSVFENSGSKSLRSGATRANIDEFGNNIPCGIVNRKPQSKIVRGKDTLQNEFPWVVSIQMKKEGKYEPFCGGIIVNKDYILTAAHCTNGWNSSDVRIQAGKFNLKVSETHEQTKGVEEIIEDGFDKNLLRNDYALLKLSSSLQLEKGYVTPGCIPKGDEKFDNSVEATGWGKLRRYQSSSGKLQKVNLSLLEYETCKKRYTDVGYESYVYPCQICTLAPPPKDICQGDSGGPVMCTIDGDDSKKYVCGVVSFSLTCASSLPSIHTKVSCIYDWIKGIAGV